MVLQASPKLAVNLVSRQVVQSRKTGAHEQALVMGRDFVYGNSDGLGLGFFCFVCVVH